MLAAFLPTELGDFARWSATPRSPYVPRDAERIGGFYRMQVQTVEQLLPLDGQTPCKLNAAGMLYTRDKAEGGNSQESLLIEISDYGGCSRRIRQGMDHFALIKREAGSQTERQYFLDDHVKLRITREARKGGELKAIFLINDRYQVFMLFQGWDFPPDEYFLTGYFQSSSLARLRDLAPARSDKLDPSQLPSWIDPAFIYMIPASFGNYRNLDSKYIFEDHYRGIRTVLSDADHHSCQWTLYDFAGHPDGWQQFMEEIHDIGKDVSTQVIQGASYHGLVKRPVGFRGEAEATLILHDRFVLRLYVAHWPDVSSLLAELEAWAANFPQP